MGARRKVEVRREELLAATVAEITERGLAQVRVEDVARALGVSRALVFYHFETKDALLTAALEYAVDRDLARLDFAMARDADVVSHLRRVLRAYSPQGSAPGWTLWIDTWAAALREPDLRATLRRLDRRWRQEIEAAITDGVRAGVFTCPDPRASAQRLAALLDGLAVQVTVHRRLSRRQMADWVNQAAAAEVRIDPSRLR